MHSKIAALNEKTYKASIKTTVLGKDSAKSEYWHFKDDNTRIYIRVEEEISLNGAVIQGDACMLEDNKLEAQGIMVDAEDKQHELGVQKEST